MNFGVGKSLDKSIRLYREKVGMELVGHSDEWKSATMKIGSVDYDICQPVPKWRSNWMKAKRNIGGLRGIFFYTNNINKTYEEMKTRGDWGGQGKPEIVFYLQRPAAFRPLMQMSKVVTLTPVKS